MKSRLTLALVLFLIVAAGAWVGFNPPGRFGICHFFDRLNPRISIRLRLLNRRSLGACWRIKRVWLKGVEASA